ncbi:MAG: hypothetical protein ABIH83_03440, partial [Candidatus Micrarchaeota archaeon]
MCNFTDSQGTPTSICCAVGEFCANATGQCCAVPACEFTNSSGTYGACCGEGESCLANEGGTNLCCPHSAVITYSQPGQGGDYTQTLYNDCTGICCDEMNEYDVQCLEECYADPECIDISICLIGERYACIGDVACCLETSVCLTGAPGSTDPFPPAGPMEWACCAETETCASMIGATVQTQPYTCCPSSRQCDVPAEGENLAYTCCADGEDCNDGNFCCPSAQYCKGEDDAT